jgi:phage portal protein BeeE
MAWRDRLFGTRSDRPKLSGNAAAIAGQKARAAEALSLHAAGRMTIEQSVEHMTGRRAVFITAPDADGFMPLTGFSASQIDDSIAASTWFYSCAVSNARSASDLPPVVQVKDSKGEWQRDRQHPLNDLLSAPLGGAPGWPRWSWKQLAQTVFMQLPGEGNSFLKPALVNDTAARQRLAALFPIMRPGSVQAIENTSADIRGPLLGWDLGDGSPQLALNELVNVMTPTAGSLWDGIAPMAVAQKAIETDAIAASRQRWNMENRISHGVIISIEDEWGFGATSTQEQQILTKLAEQYTASADDGKPIILGKGAKVSAPPTSEELQVFDPRNFSKKEILAIMGTPPPMIGDYENATLQNFDKAFASWWMNVLFPLNHDFYGALNSQAVWPVYGTSTRLWYDVSRTDIGVMLQSARLDVAAKILALGHTANTAAAEVGLDLEFVAELETYNRDLQNAGRVDPAVTDGQTGAE